MDNKTNIKNLPIADQIAGTDLVLVSVNGKARRALASLLKGQKGDEVELRITETHIQWRLTNGEWANLISFAELRGPVEDAAEEARQAAQEAGEATVAAGEAIVNANAATKSANEAAGIANTQAGRAKEWADHPTVMKENGNWWKWDEEKKEYVDTGSLAKGGVLYPSFEINIDDMHLYMIYQDEISSDMFELKDGHLIFKFK